MLGVFDSFTGKQPEELLLPSLKRPDWIRTCDDVKKLYVRLKADADTTFYNFPNGNFMALSQKDEQQPRTVLVMDDIFCIFFGTLENFYDMRVHYGLSRRATEAMVVSAAYQVLRERGPFPPDHVLREFKGNYAFMLFDTKFSKVFLARGRDGGMELHWGTAADGSLVCCDDSKIILGACGNCYSPFPQGFFFLSGYGLISYDHPYNKVTAIQHKDETGRIRGLDFLVDLNKKLNIITRKGSGDKWPFPGSLDFKNWSLGSSSSDNIKSEEKELQQNIKMEIGSASYNADDGIKQEPQLANWSLPLTSKVKKEEEQQ